LQDRHDADHEMTLQPTPAAATPSLREREFLRVGDVVRLLGRCERSVRGYIASGELASRRTAGQLQIPRAALEAFAAAHALPVLWPNAEGSASAAANDTLAAEADDDGEAGETMVGAGSNSGAGPGPAPEPEDEGQREVGAQHVAPHETGATTEAPYRAVTFESLGAWRETQPLAIEVLRLLPLPGAATHRDVETVIRSRLIAALGNLAAGYGAFETRRKLESYAAAREDLLAAAAGLLILAELTVPGGLDSGATAPAGGLPGQLRELARALGGQSARGVGGLIRKLERTERKRRAEPAGDDDGTTPAGGKAEGDRGQRRKKGS
jgi:hypothetical protein